MAKMSPATRSDSAISTTDGLPAPPEGRRLPIGYYLDNFERLLATVEGRDADLLLDEDRVVIAAFKAASLGARRLYVRLASRRGPWFRTDRLDYPEIPELDAAVAELLGCGLLDRGDTTPEGRLASLDARLALLRKPELVSLARARLEPPPARSIGKDVLLFQLERDLPREDLAAALERDWGERMVRLCGVETLRTLRLLFFGNLRQTLSDFVIADLGILRYEAVELSPESRLFRDRRELELARAAHDADLLLEWLLPDDIDEAIALVEPWRTEVEALTGTLRRRADGLLCRVGRALERLGREDEALRFYEPAHRPPARERRARLLDKLGRREEALRLAEDVAREPRDEVERGFGPSFAHRMRRKLGRPSKAPPRRRPKRVELALELDRSRPVEQQALDAWRELGWDGWHTENRLWKTVIGLLLWDVIHAPVPGAFLHPFQVGPLDLWTPEFAKPRSELIEKILKVPRTLSRPSEELTSGWLERFDEKSGLANALVGSGPELREALSALLERAAPAALAAVCDRFLVDPRRMRTGFPDLLLVERGGDGLRLCEVKGPGDQLRPEQRSWLEAFSKAGFDAFVLNIEDCAAALDDVPESP